MTPCPLVLEILVYTAKTNSHPGLRHKGGHHRPWPQAWKEHQAHHGHGADGPQDVNAVVVKVPGKLGKELGMSMQG